MLTQLLVLITNASESYQCWPRYDANTTPAAAAAAAATTNTTNTTNTANTTNTTTAAATAHITAPPGNPTLQVAAGFCVCVCAYWGQWAEAEEGFCSWGAMPLSIVEYSSSRIL